MKSSESNQNITQINCEITQQTDNINKLTASIDSLCDKLNAVDADLEEHVACINSIAKELFPGGSSVMINPHTHSRKPVIDLTNSSDVKCSFHKNNEDEMSATSMKNSAPTSFADAIKRSPASEPYILSSYERRKIERQNRQKSETNFPSFSFKAGVKPERRRFAWINCVPQGVTESQIANDLLAFGILADEVSKTSHENASLQSFKIGVPESQFEIIIAPGFWPDGVGASEFKRRQGPRRFNDGSPRRYNARRQY